MLDPKTLNSSFIAQHFSDEEEAYKLIESIRWPNGPVCPHCGSVDHAYFLEPKDGSRITRTGAKSYRRLWKCAECRKQFSVLVGTIFEDSKIPLNKWLLAIHELCADKNGMAALELSRKLDITYKSAWFMAHRIRYAMERGPLADKLKGKVEADETYVGGKAEGGKRGRGAAKKTAVVTLVERDGELRSRVVPDTTSKTLDNVLKENIDRSATLMTDTYASYETPGLKYEKHETVNHSEKEYARGDVHVNSAEGYFSQFKRSIDGTHHKVSPQHLHRYASEFDYRYNTRKQKDGERTVKALEKTTGKRLMYREPKGNAEVLVSNKADKNDSTGA